MTFDDTIQGIIDRANAWPREHRCRTLARLTGKPDDHFSDATFRFEPGDPPTVHVTARVRPNLERVFFTTTVRAQGDA